MYGTSRMMQALFFLCNNMEYTLLMQKMKEGASVKDSLTDFDIVCTSVPFEGTEVKELPSNNWLDEDGDDTYIPDVLPISGYDMEIGMCYKGALSSCYTKMKAFRDYLTGKDGSGAAMKIYSQYTGIGRQNVYCTSISDPEFSKSNIDEVLEFSVTLHVTDPVTDVVLNKE